MQIPMKYHFNNEVKMKMKTTLTREEKRQVKAYVILKKKAQCIHIHKVRISRDGSVTYELNGKQIPNYMSGRFFAGRAIDLFMELDSLAFSI